MGPASETRREEPSIPGLEGELEDLIGRRCPAPLAEMALAVLAKAVPLLAQPTWPPLHLPWIGSEALGGCPPASLAAVQRAAVLLYAAADVMDDAQDAELGPDWDRWLPINAYCTSQGLYSLAILALDAAVLGHRLASELQADLARAALAMAAGQALDLLLPARAPSIEDYEAAVLGKAGASCGFFAAAGARLACAGRADQGLVIESLRNFGTHSGAIVQLHNDLTDLHDPNKVLRPHANLAFLYVAQRGTPENRDELAARIGEGLPGRPALLALLKRTGAMGYAELRIRLHRKEALAALAAVSEGLDRGTCEAYLDHLEGAARTPHATAL